MLVRDARGDYVIRVLASAVSKPVRPVGVEHLQELSQPRSPNPIKLRERPESSSPDEMSAAVVLKLGFSSHSTASAFADLASTILFWIWVLLKLIWV